MLQFIGSVFAFVAQFLCTWFIVGIIAVPLLVTAFLVAGDVRQHKPHLLARVLLVASMIIAVIVIVWLVFAPVASQPQTYGVKPMTTAQYAPRIALDTPCILPDDAVYQYAPSQFDGEQPSASQLLANTRCVNLPRMATLYDLTHACYYFGARHYLLGTPVYDLAIHYYIDLPCGAYAPRLLAGLGTESLAHPGCMLATLDGTNSLIWCPSWQQYITEFGPQYGVIG